MNTYMVKLNSQQDVINFVNMMGKRDATRILSAEALLLMHVRFLE